MVRSKSRTATWGHARLIKLTHAQRAVAADDVDQLAKFLETPGIVNTRSQRSYLELITPLSSAVQLSRSPSQLAHRCPCSTPSSCSLSAAHGLTLLHVAAAYGAMQCLELLINTPGIELDARDHENSWNALHRAAYHAQLHMSNAAQGLNSSNKHEAVSIFGWGDNSTFALGLHNDNTSIKPRLVTFPHNVAITTLSTSKFHTLFLTTTGRVYACGHGRGGRLGIGALDYSTLGIRPLDAPSNVRFVAVAAGRDHSLFVTTNGFVLSCGTNQFGQLGMRDVAELHTPAILKTLRGQRARLAAASGVHSVIVTDGGIFTCGQSNGQLGHSHGRAQEAIFEPKLIPDSSQFVGDVVKVEASDSMTVALRTTGLLVLWFRKTERKDQEHLVLHVIDRFREQVFRCCINSSKPEASCQATVVPKLFQARRVFCDPAGAHLLATRSCRRSDFHAPHLGALPVTANAVDTGRVPITAPRLPSLRPRLFGMVQAIPLAKPDVETVRQAVDQWHDHKHNHHLNIMFQTLDTGHEPWLTFAEDMLPNAVITVQDGCMLGHAFVFQQLAALDQRYNPTVEAFELPECTLADLRICLALLYLGHLPITDEPLTEQQRQRLIEVANLLSWSDLSAALNASRNNPASSPTDLLLSRPKNEGAGSSSMRATAVMLRQTSADELLVPRGLLVLHSSVLRALLSRRWNGSDLAEVDYTGWSAQCTETFVTYLYTELAEFGASYQLQDVLEVFGAFQGLFCASWLCVRLRMFDDRSCLHPHAKFFFFRACWTNAVAMASYYSVPRLADLAGQELALRLDLSNFAEVAVHACTFHHRGLIAACAHHAIRHLEHLLCTHVLASIPVELLETMSLVLQRRLPPRALSLPAAGAPIWLLAEFGKIAVDRFVFDPANNPELAAKLKQPYKLTKPARPRRASSRGTSIVDLEAAAAASDDVLAEGEDFFVQSMLKMGFDPLAVRRLLSRYGYSQVGVRRATEILMGNPDFDPTKPISAQAQEVLSGPAQPNAVNAGASANRRTKKSKKRTGTISERAKTASAAAPSTASTPPPLLAALSTDAVSSNADTTIESPPLTPGSPGADGAGRMTSKERRRLRRLQEQEERTQAEASLSSPTTEVVPLPQALPPLPALQPVPSEGGPKASFPSLLPAGGSSDSKHKSSAGHKRSPKKLSQKQRKELLRQQQVDTAQPPTSASSVTSIPPPAGPAASWLFAQPTPPAATMAPLASVAMAAIAAGPTPAAAQRQSASPSKSRPTLLDLEREALADTRAQLLYTSKLQSGAAAPTPEAPMWGGSSLGGSSLERPTAAAGGSFREIVRNLEKERDHAASRRGKSVQVIQIEEAAITALHELYNTADAADEVVSIVCVPRS
ncbi:uncharacterized protein MONBRDRAFT_11635 [Monosiga brevicollis MX1]|uniref:UBA domain-containing protein n=1 Tax=Monosiga brevicollis TaxID=81824 RepID=A9V9V0_MONBE|nr:uncharacterized protein MONBRDRAFT_11635 [Monosiga brevicollis MX1]EDQ85787.1 predicted protein [Monosiga brevicollis MX1]|eukprot:XP_001749502.1 hypothetical protein [Monosiga brevicollis MX1]